MQSVSEFEFLQKLPIHIKPTVQVHSVVYVKSPPFKLEPKTQPQARTQDQ